MMVQCCLQLLYQYSKTIIECDWLQMARMEKDGSLKTLFFPCFLEKSPKAFFVFPLRKSVVFFLLKQFSTDC